MGLMRSPGYKRALAEADRSKEYQLHYGISIIPESKIVTDRGDKLASNYNIRSWKKYRRYQWK